MPPRVAVVRALTAVAGSTGYVVCEVNSSPGFEGLENATKTNVARDMLDQVVITCQEHQHDEARQRRAIKKFPLQEEHK